MRGRAESVRDRAHQQILLDLALPFTEPPEHLRFAARIVSPQQLAKTVKCSLRRHSVVVHVVESGIDGFCLGIHKVPRGHGTNRLPSRFVLALLFPDFKGNACSTMAAGQGSITRPGADVPLVPTPTLRAVIAFAAHHRSIRLGRGRGPGRRTTSSTAASTTSSTAANVRASLGVQHDRYESLRSTW